MSNESQTDYTKLRYVLYARKSTEDENRQIRSIPDQIKDCEKLASDLGLHVKDIVRETKSAKKPNERPLFKQMLEDLEAKKYDAILCWHPDRLCRNMLEGGQIINMLDEGVLKDIRFHSHQFSNDANGKMLLGMLFVFSKQYSDDLSAKVTRGTRNNFSEGKSAGTPKWGYDRNEITGLYEPNRYFDQIVEVWSKRALGESLEAVTDYLLKEGVHRMTKDKRRPRPIKPSVSSMSNMFKDSFYYGVLEQAKNTADLRAIHNFIPVSQEDTYNRIQAMTLGRTKDKFTKKRATFYPLHGFVYCDVCNNSKYMVVGKNRTGSGHYVLSYRCDNKVCTRKPKSMRAKHIFNSVYERLDNFELTDKAYERYSKRIDSFTDDKLVKIKQDIHSRRGALAHITNEIKERALSTGLLDSSSAIYKANETRIGELSVQQADLEQTIAKLAQKVANPQQMKLDKDEFLNLLKTASAKMKAGSAVEKDALCRILFLNLRVDNEKVASYIWREPFASLVKATELSYGGADR